jgi:hypothetical protein
MKESLDALQDEYDEVEDALADLQHPKSGRADRAERRAARDQRWAARYRAAVEAAKAKFDRDTHTTGGGTQTWASVNVRLGAAWMLTLVCGHHRTVCVLACAVGCFSHCGGGVGVQSLVTKFPRAMEVPADWTF